MLRQLERALPADQDLLVTLETTTVEPSVSVRLSEIRKNHVWFRGQERRQERLHNEGHLRMNRSN